MTAEQFHDALGLLPSDLIAGADAWRSRPRKKIIPWKRWAAMAACAVLVLGCGFAVTQSGLLNFSGGSTEKLAVAEDMAECAPQAPEAPAAAAPMEPAMDSANSIVTGEGAGIDPSAAQTYRTSLLPGTSVCAAGNQGAVFTTAEEWEDYLSSCDGIYDLSALEEAEAIDFEANDLLVVRIGTEKSGLVPVIQEISLSGQEGCTVTISFAEFPEDNTPDPACWHILLPLTKGVLAEQAIVTIEIP